MPAEITTIIDGEPEDYTLIMPGLGARFTIFDAEGNEGSAVVACHEEDRKTEIMIFDAPVPASTEDLGILDIYRRSHIVRVHTIGAGHEPTYTIEGAQNADAIETVEYRIGHTATMLSS